MCVMVSWAKNILTSHVVFCWLSLVVRLVKVAPVLVFQLTFCAWFPLDGCLLVLKDAGWPYVLREPENFFAGIPPIAYWWFEGCFVCVW